jgi:pimeloyl-ACP methyl ester carboxylesterase
VRQPSTPADLSSQAAAIATLIDRLQLGPVFAVGHSLGGAVALTLALEHTGCVTGLALVAPLTHLPDGGKPPAAFRALMISSSWLRTLFAWTLAVPASIAGRRAVLEQVFGPDAIPRDFATRGGGLLSLRPSQFIAASRDLQALQDRMPAITSRYGELRIPIRVLFGREDRILDWKVNGQALVDKVKTAELTLVEGGHMLPVTKPELTARFIQEAVRNTRI